jgi:hypothetical protein
LSTTSKFAEFKSFDSDVVGRVTLLTGPHTKGKPFEVHVAFSFGSDRGNIDTLKSYIGIEKGLDTVKICYNRDIPAQVTLTMKEDVRTTAKAKAIAAHSVQRLITFKEKQHNCKPAMAVNSVLSRGEQLY